MQIGKIAQKFSSLAVGTHLTARSRHLPADVARSGNHYFVQIDVPGLNCSNLRVESSGPRLIVTTSPRRQPTHATWVLRERQTAPRKRTFRFGENLDSDHITLRCTDGVLRIIAPIIPPQEPTIPTAAQRIPLELPLKLPNPLILAA